MEIFMTEVYIIVNLYSEGKQILIANGLKWSFFNDHTRSIVRLHRSVKANLVNFCVAEFMEMMTGD